MKRYASIPITLRYDNKRVFLTTNYPIIYPSDDDIIIVTNEADYLDSLAYKYYGDPTLWFIIALANPGVGKGRLSLSPGLNLRIPTNINEILDKYNKLNSTNI